MSRAAWTAALAVLLLAAPVWASQVRQVRVGNHPTFTRVVFELDAPAGYRFERRGPEGGPAEIVVTLEAGSTSRTVTSRSVMVERVGIDAARDRAVARIRLKKSPSRVKELILTNPPRIVLDLVFPEAQIEAQRAAAARRARPRPAKEPRTAEPPAAEREIRLEPLAPAPETAAEEPEPIAEAPAPEPIEPEPAAEPPGGLAEVEESPAPEPGADLEALLEPEAVPDSEGLPGEPERFARAPTPTLPTEAAPGGTPAARRWRDWLVGVDWVTWGGAAAGVLAVLLAVVLVVRRRASQGDLDVMALAEREADDGGAIPAEGFAMGEDATVAIGGPASQREPEAEGSGIAAGPGLFDDEPEKESETMDTRSTDLPAGHSGSEMPTQAGAVGGEGDVMRLVRDLERRVSQLETRLDESLEARERLERQVAAQSEELRVQRTAIARTQRALRSLNRGEEEQATEPALREPSK